MPSLLEEARAILRSLLGVICSRVSGSRRLVTGESRC